MVENGILGLRRVDKHDLRRIAKASGAHVCATLATPEGEEVFPKENLGTFWCCESSADMSSRSFSNSSKIVFINSSKS
jgi:hypothetical protein